MFAGRCRLEGEGHENHFRTDLLWSVRPSEDRIREDTCPISEGTEWPADTGTWGRHTEDREIVGETVGGCGRAAWRRYE